MAPTRPTPYIRPMSTTYGHIDAPEPRPLLPALWRGWRSKCPHCGEGSLFASWIRPVDACAACGEDYRAQRADDLPPYLVIFIVGHVVVAGYMMGEEVLPFGAWAQMALWSLVTVLMSLALMRPIKGATIGLQWSRRMFGFGDPDADATAPTHGEPVFDLPKRTPPA